MIFAPDGSPPRTVMLDFCPIDLASSPGSTVAFALRRIADDAEGEFWVTELLELSLLDGHVEGEHRIENSRSDRYSDWQESISLSCNAATGRILLAASASGGQESPEVSEVVSLASGKIGIKGLFSIQESEWSGVRVVSLVDVKGTDCVAMQLCGGVDRPCCSFYLIDCSPRPAEIAGARRYSKIDIEADGERVACRPGGCQREFAPHATPHGVSIYGAKPGCVSTWLLSESSGVSRAPESSLLSANLGSALPLQAMRSEGRSRVLVSQDTKALGSIVSGATDMLGRLYLLFENDKRVWTSGASADSVRPASDVGVVVGVGEYQRMYVAGGLISVLVDVGPDRFDRIKISDGSLVAPLTSELGMISFGSNGGYVDHSTRFVHLVGPDDPKVRPLDRRPDGQWYEFITNSCGVGGGGFCLAEEVVDYWSRRICIVSTIGVSKNDCTIRLPIDGSLRSVVASSQWVLLRSGAGKLWAIELGSGQAFKVNLPAEPGSTSAIYLLGPGPGLRILMVKRDGELVRFVLAE